MICFDCNGGHARGHYPASPDSLRRRLRRARPQAYSLEDYHTPEGVHVTRENFAAAVSPFDLADTYLPHFRAAVLPVASRGAAAAGVMMAMNSVGPTPGGADMVPCTANTALTGALLKWSGLVGGGGAGAGVLPPFYLTSDGGNMITDMVTAYPAGHGWCPYHAPLCSVDEAVEAAADARCAIADGSEYAAHTVSSIAAGNVTAAAIRVLLRDTLRVRMALGLFDNLTAADSPYMTYGLSDLGAPRATAANALAARQALVLLARGVAPDGVGGPVLPLRRGGPGATAVIGFAVNATGHLLGNYVGQFCPDPAVDCFPTILASIAALGEEVVYARGCANASACSDEDVAAATAAAAGAARVVLQLGLDQSVEREQLDRATVALPPPQRALFAAVAAAATAARAPLAVVLIGGGAIAVPEVAASPAGIINAFYPGTLGGPAIAGAVFGVFSPGGKLPHDVYNTSYDEVDFTDMRVAALGRTYRRVRAHYYTTSLEVPVD